MRYFSLKANTVSTWVLCFMARCRALGEVGEREGGRGEGKEGEGREEGGKEGEGGGGGCTL